ncbi:MAG: thioredoxin [Anaerolineae bacterium]
MEDATFDEVVLGAELPVLVDFWAPWCMPCRMLAPTVEEIAREYRGRLIVAKMNTDENPATPGKFGIMGIPTLILFKNGQEVDRVVGVRPKQALLKQFAPHLQ